MVAAYERMFGSKPKTMYLSPLEKGDHPELDTFDLLEPGDIQKYQSLIGAMQWAVSIGRLDINTAVMTLSGFQVAPRVDHMERQENLQIPSQDEACHSSLPNGRTRFL